MLLILNTDCNFKSNYSHIGQYKALAKGLCIASSGLERRVIATVINKLRVQTLTWS